MPRKREVHITLFNQYLQEVDPGLAKKIEEEYFRAPSDIEATRNTIRRFTRNKEIKYSQQFINECFDRLIPLFDGYIPTCAGLDEISEDMNKTTASGWPSYVTKQQAYMYDGMMESYIAGLEGRYEKGIWKIAAKDEVLPIDKQRSGERNFVCGHFPGYISVQVWAKHMGDFLHENWITLPGKVGSSKYHGELRSIFQSMNTQYSVLSMDLSDMEYDLAKKLHKGLAHLKTRICPHFDWASFYDEVSTTVILCPCCGRLLLKNHGNCSGNCCTIDDNVLVNMMIMYVAWSTWSAGNVKFSEFMREKLAIVGDDILYSGPMKFKHIKRVYETFGFSIKLTRKTSTPNNTEFLSNEFCEGKIKPVKPLKILARLYFYKYDLTQIATTVASLYLECFYDRDARQTLKGFGLWLQLHYGIRVPWRSESEMILLYNGA